MEELLEESQEVDPKAVVGILRDREGLDDKKIGYGNEKALNQLLAHHGIVFKPEDLMVWISSNPYQMGEFVAYDLKNIFKDKSSPEPTEIIAASNLNIPADPFLDTDTYKDYERYRVLRHEVESAINNELHIDQTKLEQMTALNPNFWEGYYLAALYNYQKGYEAVALTYFLAAEEKEITTVPDRESVERYIRKINRR
jgi:hypothetical protein